MSKTFDDFCRRKDCEKPYAVNCQPITMVNGAQKFAYEIRYHKPTIEDEFVSGGYCGTENTEEQALWHLHDWMFRNMLSIDSVEFFLNNHRTDKL